MTLVVQREHAQALGGASDVRASGSQPLRYSRRFRRLLSPGQLMLLRRSPQFRSPGDSASATTAAQAARRRSGATVQRRTCNARRGGHATREIPLGGPVGEIDGLCTVVVVHAVHEDDARAMFTDDPWVDTILRIESIEPWTLGIGADRRPAHWGLFCAAPAV